jgi:hypothetical protein
MASKIVRIAFSILAATLALVVATWAQPVRPPATACSNASLNGAYGILFGGTDRHGRADTTVGQVTADGNGNFSGVETESKGGVILNNIPVSGTYAIKANCTGTGIWTAQGNSTKHYNIVVISGGNAMDLIQTDSARIESGFAQAQGKPACTSVGVKGTYGFEIKGAFTGVGPVTFVGQFKLDGTGKITGIESASVNGKIFSNVKLSGTYAINSGCTGTATVTPQGQSAVNFNLVLVDAGLKILAIETDTNTSVSGSMQK